MSGKCRNCGERFEQSREELGECPGCGAGLTNPAGFMPEDMDLAASGHHQRVARDTQQECANCGVVSETVEARQRRGMPLLCDECEEQLPYVRKDPAPWGWIK